MPDPAARPRPQVGPMLAALAEHRVDWVLSGSAVLVLYGADVRPNDLDVVPSLERDNLERVASLLAALGAVPAHFPGWAEGPSLAQCRAWRPEPAEDALDHLFVTELGMLDIPPRITGSYAELKPRATRVRIAGMPVWVCDPAEVLARLDGRGRAKDRERAPAYAHVRERIRRGEGPVHAYRLG